MEDGDMSSFDFGPNPNPPVTADRRKERRSYGWDCASFASNLGQAQLACIVRSVSRNGAMLYVDDPASVTAVFHLKIAGYSQELLARVRWHAPRGVGVEFVDQAGAAERVMRSPHTAGKRAVGDRL
jgi:hypothetical protein